MGKGKFTQGPWRVESARDFASIMRLISSAPEMYALLGRVEDYFKNRHIYGYGVEESVSSDLLAKIKEVIKRIDGEKQKDSLHRR